MDKKQRSKLVERALGTQDAVRRLFASAVALLIAVEKSCIVLTVPSVLAGQLDFPEEGQGAHGQVRSAQILETDS